MFLDILCMLANKRRKSYEIRIFFTRISLKLGNAGLRPSAASTASLDWNGIESSHI